MSTADVIGQAVDLGSRRRVALWLFVVAGMVFVMVTLGGATRLTGSGLSIMEWAPLMGALPPMSHAEWERLFALYKGIPQYTLLNEGFGLAGFQRIFWLEYLHRLWGRLIGLAFAAPLTWFWITGQIERSLRIPLLGLLILGGAQGGVGWLMVASGFEHDATVVSPYRLVVHLGLALALYGAVLWTALSLQPSPTRQTFLSPPRWNVLLWQARLLTLLVALTILAGGFVAGLHAGLDYNTFPLMDGRIVPQSYAMLQPAWRNLTENVAAVQFDHRLLATVTMLMCLVVGWTGLRAANAPRWPVLVLIGLTALQYGLGVATLLWNVPVLLGSVHQANAIAVLTCTLILLHKLHRPRDGAVGRRTPSL